jgi:hypothetical protein
MLISDVKLLVRISPIHHMMVLLTLKAVGLRLSEISKKRATSRKQQ